MNTTAEDLAYVAWMDEQAEQAGLAEQQERERFEAWRAARLEDGYAEDEADEDAYVAELEARAGV